jgi:hypothetical protein
MVLHRAIGVGAARAGRRSAGVLAITLLLALGASSASAELVQHGNLFVHFDGGISPRALPRKALAPIGVRIEGTIRVPPGQDPPSLRRIRIAVNRAGRLNADGLPICHRRQIEATSASEALATCGRTLVGSGGIVARTTLPDQPASTVRGQILLFNSVENGRPAILAHFFQTDPTPITRVVVFEIRRNGGAFGTVITGKLPPAINRNGYLKSIFLRLERRYTSGGRQRSYLSAACSAPEGFSSAVFPFANASMTFDDGRTLASTLVRSCRVR